VAEPRLAFEARELVARSCELLVGVSDAPEQLSEVLALVEVAELGARAQGLAALAEAWTGLGRRLREGEEFSKLEAAWRIHGAMLSESEAGSALHQKAWVSLQGLLDLPAAVSPIGFDREAGTAESAAQAFLAALEMGGKPETFVEEEQTEQGREPRFGRPEQEVDAEAFLASLEGWLPPAEWPETGVWADAVEPEVGEETSVAWVREGMPEEIGPMAPAVAEMVSAAEDEVPDEVVDAFREEAREGFATMEQAIMRWEKAPIEESKALREVYRLAHGVKGAANSVGWSPLGRVLHHLETILEDRVEGRIDEAEATSLSSLVLEVLDQLREALQSGSGDKATWGVERGAGLVDQIVAWRRAATLANGKNRAQVETRRQPDQAEPEPVVAKEVSVASDSATIRVEVGRLDGLMNLAGELVVNRHRLSQKLREVNTLRSDLGLAHEHFDRLLTKVGPRGTGRGAEGMEDEEDGATLARALGEVAADARVLTGQIAQRLGSFSEEAFQFTRLTDELQSEVTQARMVPLDQVWQRLARAVRDAAGVSGKEVNYVTEGGETRMDKLVLDHVFNSLLHLVRNAVAHGIETPEQRQLVGKEKAGQLTMRGRAEGGRIMLEVNDDGAGLNADKVLVAARRRGLVGNEALLSDEAVAELIFSPGLSTAESADSVAGRGVGLDAVRAEVSQLGGEVAVRSEAGVGTTFVLSLPLSLAVDRVMVVRCGGHLLAIPLGLVEQVLELGHARWEERNGQEWLVLAGEAAILACRVGPRLGLSETEASQAVVVQEGENRVALVVDGVEQKRDAVVKPLGAVLGRHPCFTGALLTPEGRIVFVIDVGRLMKLTPLQAPAGFGSGSSGTGMGVLAEGRKRRILVVDDSPSLRLLTTRQLEGLGYEVVTANDGLQALDRLRGSAFDLVITDLEMPRLNGFGLLRALRADERWKTLPVVIVTTRDSAGYRSTAAQWEVVDYLVKPLTVTRLSAVVQRALPVENEGTDKLGVNVDCHSADAPPRNQL